MSSFFWGKQELIFDSCLIQVQNFSLFHLLVFDSLCKPSVLQNSMASPQERSSHTQRCSLVWGETPSTFVQISVVANSDNQDAQASTSISSTAVPVQASPRAYNPLCAPPEGNAVDLGGGENPTPTLCIYPFTILCLASIADAPQEDVLTPLALACTPPATPKQPKRKDDDDPLQTAAVKTRCSPPELVVAPLQQQKGGEGSASGSAAAASASSGGEDNFKAFCQPGNVSRAPPPRPRWRWRTQSPSAYNYQASPHP